MVTRDSFGVTQAIPVSNKKIDRVKEIIERHLQHMKRGVLESEVVECARELDEVKEDIRSADPDLLPIELEQVWKQMKQHTVPALGNLNSEKP